MKDIVKEALAEHLRNSQNSESNWNVAFINKDMIRGQIKPLGSGNYALINSHGSVYFSSENVVYLYPVS